MLILREYIFEMDAVKLGRLKVRNLTIGAINEIVKRLPDYQKRSGRDITITSASVLCIDDKANAIDGSQLSDHELTVFAEQFLEKNPRLMKVNGVEVSKITRLEGESPVDYCGRVIADEVRSYYDRMTNVLEKSGAISAFKELNKITDMLKESSRLSAFSGLKSASDSIRSAVLDVERFSASNLYKMTGMHDLEKQSRSIYEAMVQPPATIAHVKPRIERMEIPMPPPNPVYKTNEKLEDLAERVDVFTGTLTEHLTASAVALKDVAEQLEKGTISTGRQNNIMIGLTVVSIIVAVAATYVGYRGYTMGNTPPTATAAPAAVKPRPVLPKKTTKEMKIPHSTPDGR